MTVSNCRCASFQRTGWHTSTTTPASVHSFASLAAPGPSARVWPLSCLIRAWALAFSSWAAAIRSSAARTACWGEVTTTGSLGTTTSGSGGVMVASSSMLASRKVVAGEVSARSPAINSISGAPDRYVEVSTCCRAAKTSGSMLPVAACLRISAAVRRASASSCSAVVSRCLADRIVDCWVA